MRPPPAGPCEADNEAVVRRANDAECFHAGLQSGVCVDDAWQRIAVAVDKDAHMAIPGLGLEIWEGKVAGAAAGRIVAISQVGGEEFVGVKVFAATGDDHGRPSLHKYDAKRTGRQGCRGIWRRYACGYCGTLVRGGKRARKEEAHFD